MPSPRGWSSDSEAHHGAGSQTHIGRRPRRCGPQGSCSGPLLGGKTRGRRTSRLVPRPAWQCPWQSAKHTKLSSVAVWCRQGRVMNRYSVGDPAGCSAFAALHLAPCTSHNTAARQSCNSSEMPGVLLRTCVSGGASGHPFARLSQSAEQAAARSASASPYSQ